MKVLIVDDSQLVRERVAKRVSDIPGVVVTGEAENSIDAIELVSEKQPDVIILDIKIPGESGIEVLRKIKTEFPLIKVIMLTNYPFLQYRSRCFEHGADFFLDKSEEFDRVVEILTELGNSSAPVN